VSVSKLFQRQQYEVVLRSIISALNQGMTKTMGFPSTNYNHHLDEALKHMQAARQELRAWAAANDIEIHESMPT
jgi:hypothetical protein